MQFKPYWHDTTPPFTGAEPNPPEGHYDVAVIGGGFTGLSAALHLAKAGTRVAVFEAGHVGSGASGRNGGHLNNGLAHSYIAAKEHLGPERARALYKAFDISVDTVERIVREENIDCSFRRAGKLKLASKPAHFDSLARNFEAIHAEVDADTALLRRGDLVGEVGSNDFHGGMLSRQSAMMDMGRYVGGLATAAARHGAVIFEGTPVTEHKTDSGGHRIVTPRGSITADSVILATGAYTDAGFSYFRNRIIPVGSFIIATRPLTQAEIAATMPGNRTYVTSMNIGNYFRLAPDNRMIFGGRARFSATSDQRSDGKSGAILRANLVRLFPHLADVEIDYCWGGLVDMTQDRYPRAGFANGVWYSMGYSGHGAQMSTQMGIHLADAILGRGDRNPFAGLEWPAIPGYSGKPWFLPLVGLYYKFLDRVQ
ncbi:FAD-binding oxidoreductase [Phyllobacterium sp. 0TCS1.6C]|uniref:NAD(P)/FAD-dependent oxidoreductase n=1 Tax=unclassified Phyllobacterium TaxID=2638441 RepID=UPI0022640F94|nr:MULTISPECIES: FAD-binding oxidoreductase [unclassified Phyllobacterium]MCX8278823.1 FAD-binding oxidoreductase [Phyllobacterium sp. 0TCS1.6C]MCX8293607.1 FAD-binding oxidoreductase [Phyllobacterium sp. 0TCS1.6A]